MARFRLIRLIVSTILMLTCTIPALAQKIQVQAHVQDELTGESLPYVSIYVSKDNGTIANADGDFVVSARPDEVLQFSYVGYEMLRIKASEVGDTVKMKVMDHVLHQVSVLPVDGILLNTVKKLNKEYNSKWRKSARYFCRMMQTLGDNEELIECFIEGNSAINLRNLEMLNGRRGQVTRYGIMRPILSDINLQHALEVGPMVMGVNFWRHHILPLESTAKKNYFRKHYDILSEVITGENDEKIYCLDMQKREDSKEKGLLVGKLYINANTFQLLKFEGEVTDMYMEVKRGKRTYSQKVQVKLTINYTQRNGFTEVEDISCEIGQGDLHTRSVLHNVSDLKIKFKKHKSVSENMLSAIDAAGFDSTMWAHAGIFKRTEAEERIAQQQARIDSAAITQHTGVENLDMKIDRLRQFANKLPQEKVFLHLDNTCYFLGDTIWFAAYSRRTSDDKPSDVSNVLHVELLNNDGYVMSRQNIEMKDGRGHGNLYLDPQYYAGYYEIRAYTRWQLNFGEFEHDHGHVASGWFNNEEKEHEYYRDYDKLYSRVVPVYDAPRDSLHYEHDMTLRPMRRYFKKDPNKRELVLTLFPEGGELVKGLPCRVAFEAAWDDGQWVDGTLSVADTIVHAANRGRGVFTYTPGMDDQKAPVFTTTDGQTIKGKWPDIQASGVALSVKRKVYDWQIDLQMTPDLVPDSMAMTIMHQGIPSHVIPIKDYKHHQEILNHTLKPGVNQVTVFDTNGRVWADRLFFVHSPSLTEPILSITGIDDEYRPYQQVTLDIQANNPADAAEQPLSVSVRDAWNGDYLYDTGNMLTEMLLASEIKGFVPQPEWFFEKDDWEHRNALDLLMMTQGWRRFVWRDMAVAGEWTLRHPEEKSLVLDGSVSRTRLSEYELNEYASQAEVKIKTARDKRDLRDQLARKETKNELLVHGELVDINTMEGISADIQTQNHRFRLKVPNFHEKAIFFLSAADASKWAPDHKHDWITLAKPGVEDPDYTIYLSQYHPRFVKPYNWYQKNLAPAPTYKPGQMGHFSDGVTHLNEVSVTRKRNGQREFKDSEYAFIVDAYDAYNNAMDAGLATDPEGIVRSYIGDMGLEDPTVTELIELDAEGNPVFGRTSRIKVRYGANMGRRVNKGLTMDEDSMYLRQNLSSDARKAADLSPGERKYYYKTDHWNQVTSELDFSKLDKFVIYTDYMPRLEGDHRYAGSNLPDTRITLYPYPDMSQRVFYRDRRYILDGFSVADEFYHPDYSNRTLPASPAADRRRTLYWNPDLKLDADGHARVEFYNCGRNTKLSVTAEGMTEEGKILTGSAE